MQIIIETASDSHEHMRSLALMLLHIVGDIKDDKVAVPPAPTDSAAVGAKGTQSLEIRPQSDKIEVAAAGPVTRHLMGLPSMIPPPPPPPPPPMSDNDADVDVDVDGDFQQNFIPPPPPPPPPIGAASLTGSLPPGSALPNLSPTGGTTSPLPMSSGITTGVQGSPQTSSLEYDKSGMPWDERIHQASKSRKADGTWKIKKGINEKSPGLLEAVVKELAARKPVAFVVDSTPPAGSVPPPPPPPPANAVAGSVPPPPPPSADSDASATGPSFRTLVDKIMAASKAGQINPGAISAIVQTYGAPNLQALASLPHLIADVDAAVDAAILGV